MGVCTKERKGDPRSGRAIRERRSPRYQELPFLREKGKETAGSVGDDGRE